MVDDEMYNITNYLYEKGTRRKYLKFFLILIITDVYKLKFRNIKRIILKKFMDIKFAVKDTIFK